MTKKNKMACDNHWKGQVIPKVNKPKKRKLSLKIFDQTVQLTFASIIGVFTAVLLEPYFTLTLSWGTALLGVLITSAIFLYTMLYMGLKYAVLEIARWRRHKRPALLRSTRRIKIAPKVSTLRQKSMSKSDGSSAKSWLWKILVFSLITVVALVFYFQTFSNYYVSSHPAVGIIGGQYPDGNYLHVNTFTLDMDTSKNVIDLTFYFTYASNGNYSAFITLPYQIQSYQNLSSANWNITNCTSGSVVIVTADIMNYSGAGWETTYFHVKLFSADNLLDRTFETNTLILPFGGSYTLDAQEVVENSGIPLGSSDNPFNGVVSVNVPYSAVGITSSLPIEHRIPTTDTQVLSFAINDFKPFQLQYVDSEARYQFEVNIVVIGVLLGVAASGWAELAIRGVTEATARRGNSRGNG